MGSSCGRSGTSTTFNSGERSYLAAPPYNVTVCLSVCLSVCLCPKTRLGGGSGERSSLAPPPYKLSVCLSVCLCPKTRPGGSVWTVMLLSVCVCPKTRPGGSVLVNVVILSVCLSVCVPKLDRGLKLITQQFGTRHRAQCATLLLSVFASTARALMYSRNTTAVSISVSIAAISMRLSPLAHSSRPLASHAADQGGMGVTAPPACTARCHAHLCPRAPLHARGRSCVCVLARGVTLCLNSRPRGLVGCGVQVVLQLRPLALLLVREVGPRQHVAKVHIAGLFRVMATYYLSELSELCELRIAPKYDAPCPWHA